MSGILDPKIISILVDVVLDLEIIHRYGLIVILSMCNII